MTTPYLDELLDSLAKIEAKAAAFDLSHHAERSTDSLVDEIGRPMIDLVIYSLNVFEEAYCLLEAGDADDRLLQESAAEASSIAFIAARGLLGHQRRLGRLLGAIDKGSELTDPFGQLHDQVEEAREEVVNAAQALARELREGLDYDPPPEQGNKGETSLLLRLAMARFWLAVDGNSQPTTRTIRPRLQRAATAIAQLRGRDAFANLRLSEQNMLEGIQQRLIEWFRTKGDDETGLRLWLDLSCFNALMRKINDRAELLERDQRVIEETLAARERGKLTTAERLEAFSLLGRDATLDTLLQAWRLGESPNEERLRSCLESVAEQIRERLGAGRQTGPISISLGIGTGIRKLVRVVAPTMIVDEA